MNRLRKVDKPDKMMSLQIMIMKAKKMMRKSCGSVPLMGITRKDRNSRQNIEVKMKKNRQYGLTTGISGISNKECQQQYKEAIRYQRFSRAYQPGKNDIILNYFMTKLSLLHTSLWSSVPLILIGVVCKRVPHVGHIGSVVVEISGILLVVLHVVRTHICILLVHSPVVCILSIILICVLLNILVIDKVALLHQYFLKCIKKLKLGQPSIKIFIHDTQSLLSLLRCDLLSSSQHPIHIVEEQR